MNIEIPNDSGVIRKIEIDQTSLASSTPAGPMENAHSASGNVGESNNNPMVKIKRKIIKNNIKIGKPNKICNRSVILTIDHTHAIVSSSFLKLQSRS